jgi:hypothetical protein
VLPAAALPAAALPAAALPAAPPLLAAFPRRRGAFSENAREIAARGQPFVQPGRRNVAAAVGAASARCEGG